MGWKITYFAIMPLKSGVIGAKSDYFTKILQIAIFSEIEWNKLYLPYFALNCAILGLKWTNNGLFGTLLPLKLDYWCQNKW